MKYFAVILSFFASSAFAVNANPQGRKSNYYYFELVPKEKLVLTLLSDKRCNNDVDKISVDEFDSTAFYSSTETKKKESVRIKNIFANSFSVCSNQPNGKLEKKIVIGPFNSQMTHIRLIASEGMQVNQSHDCGILPSEATFDKSCNIVPVAPLKSSK